MKFVLSLIVSLLILIPEAEAGTSCASSTAVGCGGNRVAILSTLVHNRRARVANRRARRATRLSARCGGVSVACAGVAVAPVCTTVAPACTTVASPCASVAPSSGCAAGACEVVLGVEGSTTGHSSYQAEAQWEANQMASRGYKGHVRGTIAGVGFAGVGWSSGGTPNTCTPNSNRQLVADATARGPDGNYRVRYWR